MNQTSEGEGGWGGGRENRGQDSDSSSFFYYIISLIDTKRWRREVTWQYHTARNMNLSCLFSLADWLIHLETGNECSLLPELQEVDLSRKQKALRSLLLDIWMDIICFCTFTRTVFIYVSSPYLLTSTKWLTMFTLSLFVWSFVLLAFLFVIPSAVHLQICLVED